MGRGPVCVSPEASQLWPEGGWGRGVGEGEEQVAGGLPGCPRGRLRGAGTRGHSSWPGQGRRRVPGAIGVPTCQLPIVQFEAAERVGAIEEHVPLRVHGLQLLQGGLPAPETLRMGPQTS